MKSPADMAEATARLERNDPTMTELVISERCWWHDLNIIATAIAHNDHLANINIDLKYIPEDGSRTLLAAFEASKSIRIVQIHNASMTDCAPIAKLVASHKLSHLLVCNSTFSVGGFARLCTALAEDDALYELDLVVCNIDDIRARWLATALERNKTLKQLDLGRNKIGKVGALAIAKALAQNNALSSIALDGNRIGSTGLTRFAKALKGNTALCGISIMDNSPQTTPATIKAFADFNAGRAEDSRQIRLTFLRGLHDRHSFLYGMPCDLYIVKSILKIVDTQPLEVYY